MWQMLQSKLEASVKLIKWMEKTDTWAYNPWNRNNQTTPQCENQQWAINTNSVYFIHSQPQPPSVSPRLLIVCEGIKWKRVGGFRYGSSAGVSKGIDLVTARGALRVWGCWGTTCYTNCFFDTQMGMPNTNCFFRNADGYVHPQLFFFACQTGMPVPTVFFALQTGMSIATVFWLYKWTWSAPAVFFTM